MEYDFGAAPFAIGFLMPSASGVATAETAPMLEIVAPAATCAEDRLTLFPALVTLLPLTAINTDAPHPHWLRLNGIMWGHALFKGNAGASTEASFPDRHFWLPQSKRGRAFTLPPVDNVGNGCVELMLPLPLPLPRPRYPALPRLPLPRPLARLRSALRGRSCASNARKYRRPTS